MYSYRWVFPNIGVPQNGRLIRENPIKMDDLGVPLIIFGKTQMAIHFHQSYCRWLSFRRPPAVLFDDLWTAKFSPNAAAQKEGVLVLLGSLLLVSGNYPPGNDVPKFSYFTNLDFTEIRGFPVLNHHLGEIGRVRSL